MVFAVGLNIHSTLVFYGTAEFDKAPFLTKQIVDPLSDRKPFFTSLRFSPDGSMLLIGTSGDVHYIVDAYEANTLARLTGPPPGIGLERSPSAPYELPLGPAQAGISGEELAWTPDGRFVVGGSVDGKVHVWDVKPPEGGEAYGSRPPPGPECTLYPASSLEGHQVGPTRALAFNPRAGVMATGGRDLVSQSWVGPRWARRDRERAANLLAYGDCRRCGCRICRARSRGTKKGPELGNSVDFLLDFVRAGVGAGERATCPHAAWRCQAGE